MKPILKWPGGKTQLLEELKKYITPELLDEYDVVGDHRYRWVVVKCPYCHAHANEGRGWNTFKARYAAVREAAEDWIKLIRRDDE